jgi:hypothetical protein
MGAYTHSSLILWNVRKTREAEAGQDSNRIILHRATIKRTTISARCTADIQYVVCVPFYFIFKYFQITAALLIPPNILLSSTLSASIQSIKNTSVVQSCKRILRGYDDDE